MIEILAPGPLTTIQDSGRPGHAHLGVSLSGAADRESYRLVTALVGNPPGAAALEVTAGGLRMVADETLCVALTGALCPVSADGGPVAYAAPFHLPAGRVLALGAPTAGLRTYVAVAGGLDVPPVLGSRSHDSLSGIGPVPLRAGDRLPLGRPSAPPLLDAAPVAPPHTGRLELTVLPGPRTDWLAEPLDGTTWTVASRSDRIGVRLDGVALRRREAVAGAELLSEGVVRGAIQLPPGGQPVVFLADFPVTGGYPVVGVLDERSCDALAQARPGQAVRLTG